MMEQEESLVKYKNLSDNICVALSFCVFAFLLEIFSSLFMFGRFPTYFYVSFLLILVYGFIIFVLPTKTLRRVVSCVLIVFQTVVSVINDVLHHITGEVFTFDKMFLAGEAAGTFSFRMVNFWHVLVILLCTTAFMFCVFALPKRIKKFRVTKMQFGGIVASCLFVMFGVFGCMSPNYLQKHNLLATEYPTTLAYSTFGFHSFYLSNIFITMGSRSSDKPLSSEQYAEYLNYLQEGNVPKTTEMTGVSEGNNVLLMLAESFDIAAIDPHFTPNLYKMWFEDGMLLKNYHAENKTNMSEGMTLFGTYGREKQLANDASLTEIYDHFSLPTLLKRSDENTIATYVHSFKSSFYQRDITHSKIGFDKTAFAGDQEEDIKEYNKAHNNNYSWSVKEVFNNYIKDSNFFEYNKELIIPEGKRFFTSFSTMVTHGTYLRRGSNAENYDKLISDENELNNMLEYMKSSGYDIEKVKSKNKFQSFLYYKAAVMDFDEMIGMIFDRLSALNILDKTTIYMFPDHNSYYDDLSFLLRGVEGNEVRNCNVSSYNVGACIYDQKLTAKYKGEMSYTSGAIVEKFTSVNDVYPTLCDILNLDYNESLCYGKSLFLDEDRIFISLKDDRYILNDKFYFYNNKVYDAKNKTETVNDEFMTQVNEILYKFKVHEKLYKSRSSFEKMLKELGY